MSKKVAKVCKLQFPAGGARPGPALASAGINMPQFCTAFNDATKDRGGDNGTSYHHCIRRQKF